MVITIEVEPNNNSMDLPMQVFEALEEPWKVARIRILEPTGREIWCRITGWSSEADGSQCNAYCAKVGDSGSGFAFLVYGGEWGIRLMPANLDDSWSIDNHNQWGEPYLLLAELADIEAM